VVKRLVLGCVTMSACVALLGCSADAQRNDVPAPAHTLLTEPLGELPAKLSDIGLYRELPRLQASSPALGYEPGYPLWSDGGEKYRSLVLPQGTSIDGTDPANYVFPVGTLIFKTFAFRTPASPDQSVPVETRLLRLNDDGWELAAYGWDEAGADADWLDLKRGQTRPVLDDDGNVVQHAIPSRLECRQCHESASSEVLGLNELQLAKSGSLDSLRSSLTPAPSEPYAALPEHGPLTTAVLGYFVGNCVHCHNGSGGAASSFDLRAAVALKNVIDQPTASSATADGIRILPGKPEQSILYLGVKGGTELEVKDMPPLGVALRDAGAVQLLADWVTALGNEDDP
jgi:hypothetical protein